MVLNKKLKYRTGKAFRLKNRKVYVRIINSVKLVKYSILINSVLGVVKFLGLKNTSDKDTLDALFSAIVFLPVFLACVYSVIGLLGILGGHN